MKYVATIPVTRAIVEDEAMHDGLISRAEAECRRLGGNPLGGGTVRFLDPNDPEQVAWNDNSVPPGWIIAHVELPCGD